MIENIGALILGLGFLIMLVGFFVYTVRAIIETINGHGSWWGSMVLIVTNLFIWGVILVCIGAWK